MLASLAYPAAFFLSGAAGLIFQVVWIYRCGLVLGSSVAAITVVLSGFMAGLAAGNALAAARGGSIERIPRAYALLEVVVAISGVAVTYLLPRVGWLILPLAHGGASGAALNAARFAIAFVMLVVPATAMGATLPLLVSALWEAGNPFGPALGRLYGWNTLGAVAGVVAAEVVLIAHVGIAGTAWCAAALNLCAGAAVLIVPRIRVRRAHSSTSAQEHGSVSLLLATGLAGALLLALEVVWFRFLSMFVLVTTLAMSLMLAVVLAGIGLGGLLASAWLARDERAPSGLPVVACAAGFAVVACYRAFGAFTVGTQAGQWTRVLWFACVLTFPVSMLSGAMFTLIGHVLQRRRQDVAGSAGWLTLANTAGAICGPPLAAFVLLPDLGMERTLFALALAYGGVAMLTVRDATDARVAPAPARVRHAARIVAAVILTAGILVFPFGSIDGYFLRAASAYSDDGSTIVAEREGASETLFVMQQQWLGHPVYSRLVTNGFSMSGTALQGQRYMRAFAYYPMLLHDGPLKRALVVCYGVGVTVGAVTHIPSVESIDVAEISKDVVAMSEAIYPHGMRPLDDPRVRLHIEDGRFFLQATGERFDLITGEPPPPRTPGTVNIYTREYFQLVHDRLAEGGIASYWVPVARPHPGTDVNTIIRAFCDVFSDCSLWNATPFDLMLIGTRGASGPRTMAEFSAPWQTPGLEARLREVAFERPEQIGATFVADADGIRQLLAGTPPLTDDFPQRLRPREGQASLSDPRYGVDPVTTRMYQELLDPHRARAAFQASSFARRFWPPELIERTLSYFDVEAIVNRVYWEGGQPLRHIEDLDAVLTNTTLRTLPLWILASDEVKQHIAEAGADQSGASEYARGLRALSGRDYAGAAQLLAAALRRGLRGPTVTPLLAYALARSGQDDLARELTLAAQPASDDERHAWEWLRQHAIPPGSVIAR